MPKPPEPRTVTYQTRLPSEQALGLALSRYAELYNRAERSLFAAMRAGGTLNELKHEFQPKFGISARQFNTIRLNLDGKIASIKNRRPELIIEAEQRIKQSEKTLAKLATRLADLRDPAAALKAGRTVRPLTPAKRQQAIASAKYKVHGKKRSLALRQSRLSTLKADDAAGDVRLCFGSKKRFHAQFNLAANGYADHADWLSDWQASRNAQFYAVGSSDECAGNQTCQARVAEDGSLTLYLRLPNALGEFGKHVEIPGVRFAYGHANIVAALAASQRVEAKTQAGKAITKRTGVAISYRFVRDDKGWRVFASTEAPKVPVTSQAMLGAIGLDINADHLALSETDRFGNLAKAWRIDLPLYGKSTDQSAALIGEAVKRIVARAKAAGKPIVAEKLDFAKKKAEMAKTDPRYARMLSSFACNKILSTLTSAAHRAGVEVIQVNPAYTSVIGAVNHAQSKGISVHQGAALAIARRGLGLSERPAVREGRVPTRNGGHVTFALPVRNRARHVWSFWSGVRTKLKTAHVAHFRCGAHSLPPPPLPRQRPALSAIRASRARSPGVNRGPDCSGYVPGDVPQ